MPGESSSETENPYGRMHVTEPVRATLRFKMAPGYPGIGPLAAPRYRLPPMALQTVQVSVEPRLSTALKDRSVVYLIITIICEYKILRFWDSDDFAGIIICDFTKST